MEFITTLKLLYSSVCEFGSWESIAEIWEPPQLTLDIGRPMWISDFI